MSYFLISSLACEISRNPMNYMIQNRVPGRFQIADRVRRRSVFDTYEDDLRPDKAYHYIICRFWLCRSIEIVVVTSILCRISSRDPQLLLNRTGTINVIQGD